jgi:subtilisin family serine protease
MTVRIAVIDSGIHTAHPHVNGVAGGISFCGDSADSIDRLGHGTAVAAAIREKAPDAELFAVKVFHQALSTSIERLVSAIDWAAHHQMHLVNLSLGTANPEHEAALRAAIGRAGTVLIVSAREDGGVRWLPGSLPGVLPVDLDWTCPREEYRYENGVFRASGFPRPIPGVPPGKNLHGLSFAVANMTGFAARVVESAPAAGPSGWLQLLAHP